MRLRSGNQTRQALGSLSENQVVDRELQLRDKTKRRRESVTDEDEDEDVTRTLEAMEGREEDIVSGGSGRSRKAKRVKKKKRMGPLALAASIHTQTYPDNADRHGADRRELLGDVTEYARGTFSFWAEDEV